MNHVNRVTFMIFTFMLYSHPWKVVKPLFLYKLDQVMRWYNSKQSFDDLPPVPNCAQVTFSEMYASIVKAADAFKQ